MVLTWLFYQALLSSGVAPEQEILPLYTIAQTALLSTMSGTRNKNRTDSASRSPSTARKGGKKGAEPKDAEETHTCYLCETLFTDKYEKMLQCERCNLWFCLACTMYSEAEYQVPANRPEFHWFCKTCEESAIQAVLVDQDIEEKKCLHEQNHKPY